MRFSHIVRTCSASAALVLAAALAAPALAHGHGGPGTAPAGPDDRPAWHGERGAPYAMDPRVRDEWLDDCRQRVSGRTDDSHAREACEAFLDRYYAHDVPPPAYGGYAYSGYGAPGGYGYPGYGYPAPCCGGQPMVMVPVMMMPRGKPDCKETVEYEYVDVPARPARRVHDKRVRIVPDKRVRIVPDKRVNTMPDKRVAQ